MSDPSFFNLSNEKTYHLVNQSFTLSRNYSYSQSSVVIWYSLTSALGLFGTFSNLLLLIVTFRLRNLSAGSSLLLGHLFLLYFILCSITLPASLMVVLMSLFDIQVSREYCSVMQLLHMILYTVSNWIDACLAVNRFVAICLPHYYSKLSSQKASLSMAGFCWLFTIACFLPFAIGTKNLGHFESMSTNQCTIKYTGRAGPPLVQFGTYGPYSIIGSVIVAVLIKISWTKLHDRKRMNVVVGPVCSRPVANVRATRAARHLQWAMVLLVSFLWCVICTIPTNVLLTLFPKILTDYPEVTFVLRSSLALVYVFNPLIFYAMSEDYRRGLRELWIRVKRTRSLRSGTSLSRTISWKLQMAQAQRSSNMI